MEENTPTPILPEDSEIQGEKIIKRQRGRPKKDKNKPMVIPDLDIDSANYRQNDNIVLSTPKKELLINQVIKEMMMGKTSNQIEAELVRNYKISPRKCRYLIHEANRVILEYTEEEREILKEKNHALLIDLYQKNIVKDDLREARTVLEVINKMYGLFSADKLEISQSVIHFEFDLGKEDEKQKTLNIEPTDYEDIDTEPNTEQQDESTNPENTDNE